jgi:hypothetical protein
MDTMTTGLEALLETADKDLRQIGEKILAQERITPEEGILLFEKGSLPFLGALANHVRERLHGNIRPISTAISISSPPMSVYSPASSVLIPGSMPIATKAGN